MPETIGIKTERIEAAKEHLRRTDQIQRLVDEGVMSHSTGYAELMAIIDDTENALGVKHGRS